MSNYPVRVSRAHMESEGSPRNMQKLVRNFLLLDQRCTALLEQQQGLAQENLGLRQEVVSWGRAYDDVKLENESLEETLRLLEAKNRKLQQTIEDQSHEVLSLQDEVRSLSAEKAEQSRAILSLQLAIDRLMTEASAEAILDGSDEVEYGRSKQAVLRASR